MISGVDSIAARHETQRIYADLTLDASTGGQAGTTLALQKPYPPGPACAATTPPDRRPTAPSPGYTGSPACPWTASHTATPPGRR